MWVSTYIILTKNLNRQVLLLNKNYVKIILYRLINYLIKLIKKNSEVVEITKQRHGVVDL